MSPHPPRTRPRTVRAAARRTSAAAVAVAAAGAVLAGCSSSPSAQGGADGASAAAQSSAPQGGDGGHGTATADPGGALPAGISSQAADALCSDLDGNLQAMRTYTVTPGKVTLNGTVITWAAQNGVDLVDLAQHREKIDEAMSVRCPDVRDGVTSALEIPDVAAGLVGL